LSDEIIIPEPGGKDWVKNDKSAGLFVNDFLTDQRFYNPDYICRTTRVIFFNSMKTIMMFLFEALISLAAFITSDDLPHLRGEMRIVLVPERKLRTSCFFSLSRSVKFFPVASFPN